MGETTTDCWVAVHMFDNNRDRGKEYPLGCSGVGDLPNQCNYSGRQTNTREDTLQHYHFAISES